MRSNWRKWVSLALGMIAVPGIAAEPVGVASHRSREIIAQSAPVSSQTSEVLKTSEVWAPSVAVQLDRLRPQPAAPAAGAIEQTAFSSEKAARSVVRGQTADMPIGPAGPVISSGPVRSTVVSVTPGPAYVPGPTMMGAPVLVDGDAAGMDPDRYAAGDGVVQQFNNIAYINSEYLRWRIRGSNPPPLLTVDATTAAQPGVIGNGTSMVVFGGTRDDTDHSGYRVRGGLWLDRDHSIGLEGVYSSLGQENSSGAAMSMGSPILALPFTDVNNVASATVIAGQGQAGMATRASSTRLWSAEANLKSNILVGPCAHVDALIGFRTVGLDDSLDLTAVSTAIVPPTQVTLNDRFAGRNRFYGGQIGATAEVRRGRWSLDMMAKIAFGTTNQDVRIDGTTVVGGMSSSGGFYTAAGVNIGQHTNHEFSIIPEAGITIGFQVTDNLRVYAGYNFLYWTNVARAGEQVNTSDASLLQQGTVIRHSDFWAQGVSVGLELRY